MSDPNTMPDLDRSALSSKAYVTLGVTDVDGILRGKTVLSDLASRDDSSIGICDCILGWDVDDQLYQQDTFSGWGKGFPDAVLEPQLYSLRSIPRIISKGGQLTLDRERTANLVLSQFAGEAAKICPRSILGRVICRAEALGYQVKCGFEYEFSLFAEDASELRTRGYRDPQPITLGNFGYSLKRIAEYAEFHDLLLEWCDAIDTPLAAVHTENGPGIWEAALAPASAMEAADRAAIFRNYLKVLAHSFGYLPTFMAKWSTLHQGLGGHLHISLVDKKSGEPVFFEQAAEGGMSKLMQSFIAGQQLLLPELTALSAPTINSYKRLQPGTWAPNRANWGIDNRTCALRVIGNNAGSKRVEYRLPGADANPYLVAAAAIASGLHGIEKRLPLSKRTDGNAYEDKSSTVLPKSLAEANSLLRHSKFAHEWLGKEFIDQFCYSRDWEVEQFSKAVTDWEAQRYFEAI